MKHRLRAGGIAAASLALAASTASAAPSMALLGNALPTAASTAHVSDLTRDGVPGHLLDGESGTKAPWSLDGRPAAKIVRHLQQVSAETVTPRLRKLVRTYVDEDAPDAERKCLAGAIYFEARGEPLEGQLAVAEVVLNRVASGEYPESICEVVTQPAQFSFVRDGRFPPIDETSVAWRTALAVAHIADESLANELGPDVLWYHADYVAPSWGRHLALATRIGAHIFYRRA